MLQKRGKIRTGEVVSKETMAQVVAGARRGALDADRQRHAKQVAIAQQMQKINAPLTALLKQDAATLQAAHDLRAMVTLPERPVFPSVPPIHIEGVSITAFTPPYPASYSDGAGYVNAAEGELSFTVAGKGYQEADATLGLGSYTANATDYQIRFYPQVQYSYDWQLISIHNQLAASSAFFRIVVSSQGADGYHFGLYDQTIYLWDKILVNVPFGVLPGNNSGYLNYPEINIVNVIAGSTYYLAITCLGTTEAEPSSLAIAQLNASVPYVFVENFGTS